MTKTYHHGDLRDQLLNAGEQALSEMPVYKVSLREIARRAGVTHAAPKHHFPSLGHLLAEIAARGFERFVVALDAAAASAADQAPAQRLLAMGRAYLNFAAQNAAAYQLMFGQREPMAMTPNLSAASFAAWQQLLAAVSGVSGESRSTAAALHVWSTVHGLAMLKIAGRVPPDMPLHQLEEEMLNLMMKGFQSK